MAHHPATRPQMLTANALRQGDVIYWQDGRWVLDMAQGQVFADPAAADAALAAAQASVTGNQVVNPYLFEVNLENDRIRPVKEREVIRGLGPSVRDDTGKQAGETPSASSTHV